MGTRGAVGFWVDGEPKLAYNHFDSYPSGLGVDVLDFLRKAEAEKGWAQLREDARAIKCVEDSEAQPSPEDIEQFGQFAVTSVGAQGTNNTVVHTWYQLLRNLQGDLAGYLNAGVMLADNKFVNDSLFCEWAYVVDLDGDGAFEVYEGFQRSAHTDGKFASESADRGYFPVRLVKSWPLGALPAVEEFLKELHPAEEGEE